MTRREREKQELRYQILEAARELFAVGGEEAVTLRAVAEKIEYSPTTIYQHFVDKKALLDELCATDFIAFSRVFKQAERVSDPIERLRRMAAIYVDFGLQNPAHYRLMFMPSSQGSTPNSPAKVSPAGSVGLPAAGTSGHPEAANPYDFLYNAVFKAMATGCFMPEHQDVAGITQLVWSGLHGVVALHFVRAKYPGVTWKPIAVSAETMVECLLEGLLVRGRRSPGTAGS